MLTRYFLVVLCVASIFAEVQDEKTACKTDDGKELKVNEQYDKPGACYANICKEDGTFAVGACGIIGLPQGWATTPVDPTKGFPACCAKPVPPLEIIPDVLDKFDLANQMNQLEISYGDNITVNMGNKLTPTQVKGQPSVNYTSWADPQGFYLLAMVDPDAPSVINPEAREFLHWLVGNIQGTDLSSGDVIAEYIGSGPPKDSGFHRYVFLVYQQPEKIIFEEPRVNKTTIMFRRKFSIRKFAEKYTLGDPKALNVYQAEYDDYVPILHAQFGLKKDN
ncbi:protein D1-like [Macrosteles quadrilineatus]|uniref:protein D1-like n=1 Tax=Macrosteles quadrilineatus TaxID=74068 RepID=UPI0023E2FF33|nr:protein D1-like [Macrosteles quadrilineatus]